MRIIMVDGGIDKRDLSHLFPTRNFRLSEPKFRNEVVNNRYIWPHSLLDRFGDKGVRTLSLLLWGRQQCLNSLFRTCHRIVTQNLYDLGFFYHYHDRLHQYEYKIFDEITKSKELVYPLDFLWDVMVCTFIKFLTKLV